MRKPPPTSTASPRETTTSLPRATARTVSMTAAALLLTANPASAPVIRRSRSVEVGVARSALARREVHFEVAVARDGAVGSLGRLRAQPARVLGWYGARRRWR